MNILIYARGENKSRVDDLTRDIRDQVPYEITINEIVSPKKIKFSPSDIEASLQAFRNYESETRECFFRLYEGFINYDILILDPSAFYGNKGKIDLFIQHCEAQYAERPHLIITLDMTIDEIIRAIMQYAQKSPNVIPFPAES